MLRIFCQEASGDARAKAVRFVYQLNAFNLFITFADQSHQVELQELFDLRKSLSHGEFFVDFYRKTWGEFSDDRQRQMLAALPYPVTGLEERFPIANLARALAKTERVFAEPKLIQLVHYRR